MLKKLSQIYANIKNKREGAKKGLIAPTLKNYFNSLFIVKYNKLMELLPSDGIVTNQGAYITDNDGNYVII